ncbi:glycosyltransferase family 1 protein [Methanosarcina sp. MSH10X1]|uniref:glycosyltransferase family 4 protein n=1 Tax=Methanosarcina sp. MSH10X1 TaxID=2507075 RepID=UPI000FFC1AE2|nr:glycosyltransferase family 4 protein [Methanosarcina sp. MSH10X1]RXA18058.1 glycosyltransferase family 1 protein [Methanosarcina sp. MSH10X1]
MLFLDMVRPLSLADGSLIHRCELVSNLARLDNEIHIFTAGRSPLSNMENIHSHYISPGSFLSLTINYFSSSVNLLGSETFDVVYTRNPNFGFLAGLFCKSRCKKMVYELNGIPEDEKNLFRTKNEGNKLLQPGKKGSFSNRYFSAHARLKLFILKKALGYSDRIIAVTPGIKANLEKSYNIPGEKIVVVSNGANTSLFKPQEQEICRKELGLDPEIPYVCFVGNLAPWQGVEYLVKAAPSILSRFPECHFLIVGDGVMKDSLLKLCRELGVEGRFIFTGVVAYNRVPLYINASDTCIAPFILARNAKIGLSPLKLYEYMACGKPVVASDISGVSDILKASEGGIPALPESPEALAEGILKLLENPGLRTKLGSKGLSYVTENYSWYSVAKKVNEVCKSELKVEI